MHRKFIRRSAKLVALLVCCNGLLLCQESSGQAEIGFQQYYLSVAEQRIANISGLTLNYSQFFPNVGLVSASLSPALSNNRFQTGDDYLRLRGLPWKGQHWNLGIGDFRLPGQLLAVPFTNVYTPEIAARGFSLEATHGGRTFGFFYGTETISNTPRVVLRVLVPQTVAGVYLRQKVGTRLLLGARIMHFSNDLVALRRLPNLLTQSSNLKSAATFSLDALFTLAGPLKWYSEVTWSPSVQQGAPTTAGRVPLSVLVGPILETRRLKFRANYTVQDASYFPLLGYYLGDRQGPFAEVTFSPSGKLDIYGSASAYQNNVANDPALPTFRNSSESAGVTLQLLAGVSLNAQLTLLDLSTRQNSASPWVASKNQQQTVALAKPFAHHNIRLTARDFNQTSLINPQRQRSGEIEDTFHIRHLVLGAGVKIQRVSGGESRTSLLYHGLVQFNLGALSAYANIETGSDLQNRTLLATNTISTTVIGASMNVGRSWEFQAEAYRNNLLTELNPQSIFVLQGQGVFVPGTLAALNQWSISLRVSRKFSWGKGGVIGDLGQYAIALAPLKGSLDGFVMEHLIEGSQPAEGVPVSLDQNRSVTTDAEGHFHFADVPEGSHKLALALDDLPADFDPGPNKERMVAVYPSKLARGDLDVIRLAFVQGRITGPPDVPVEDIVIRIAATGRYTTPDADGNFAFYNLREGDYDLAVDNKTLPEFAVVAEPVHISVAVRLGQKPKAANFRFDVHKPEKSIRKVFENKVPEPPPPAPRLPPAPRPPPAAINVPTPLPVAVPASPKARPASAAPVSAQQHNLLGRQLTQARQYQAAIAELGEAIRLAPDFALAYNGRGFAWFSLRNYAAAIEDLNQAIRLNPNYANAYQIRGLAKSAAGDPVGAAADLRSAKQLTR